MPRAPSRSAPSSRPACARTCSPRCSTPSPTAPRWWWPATIAPRATSRPTSRPSSPRARCASTRPAACATSPTWRRRRTWSACASPRSTPWWTATSPPCWSPPRPRSPRRCPTPTCARTASRSRRAACSTSTRSAGQLVACGYERVDQVEDRGQFAVRGDILDVYPATEERAVRCELFDVEVERLTWFSTFTQRSLEEAERVEIAPAAELGPEHRELAEIAAATEADERPDIADVLPVDRFRELLDLVPEDALVAVAAEEELPPALRDLWEDVTASFHDQDAHHLYVHPDRLAETLDRRASLRLSSISCDQPHEFRAQSADTAARSLREAEPELEKLVRSGYRTIVTWARRGEAERAQLNLARVQAAFLDGKPAPSEPSVLFAHAGPARGLPRPSAQAGDRARAPPAAPPPRRPARGPAHRRARLVHRPARRRAGRARGPRRRAASRASRPRPSAASRATTSSSSSATATASSCRATSCTRSAATSAPTPATRSCPSSAASSGSSRSCAPGAPPRRSPAS